MDVKAIEEKIAVNKEKIETLTKNKQELHLKLKQSLFGANVDELTAKNVNDRLRSIYETNHVAIVLNLPQVDESKLEKLKTVILKKVSQEIRPKKIEFPMNEQSNKTIGIMLAYFDDVGSCKKFKLQLIDKPLDKLHVMDVFLMGEFSSVVGGNKKGKFQFSNVNPNYTLLNILKGEKDKTLEKYKNYFDRRNLLHFDYMTVSFENKCVYGYNLDFTCEGRENFSFLATLDLDFTQVSGIELSPLSYFLVVKYADSLHLYVFNKQINEDENEIQIELFNEYDLNGHDAHQFSPDEKILVLYKTTEVHDQIGSHIVTIKAFDVATGLIVLYTERRVKNLQQAKNLVQFSNDGQYFMIAPDNNIFLCKSDCANNKTKSNILTKANVSNSLLGVRFVPDIFHSSKYFIYYETAQKSNPSQLNNIVMYDYIKNSEKILKKVHDLTRCKFLMDDNTKSEFILAVCESEVKKKKKTTLHVICLTEKNTPLLSFDMNLDMYDKIQKVMFYKCSSEYPCYSMVLLSPGGSGVPGNAANKIEGGKNVYFFEISKKPPPAEYTFILTQVGYRREIFLGKSFNNGFFYGEGNTLMLYNNVCEESSRNTERVTNYSIYRVDYKAADRSKIVLIYEKNEEFMVDRIEAIADNMVGLVHNVNKQQLPVRRDNKTSSLFCGVLTVLSSCYALRTIHLEAGKQDMLLLRSFRAPKNCLNREEGFDLEEVHRAYVQDRNNQNAEFVHRMTLISEKATEYRREAKKKQMQ